MKTGNNEAVARVAGLPISSKMSIEICSNIRGMNLDKAIAFVEDVTRLKRAVKIRRFNQDLGHKAGCGPARYPVKAAEAFVSILKLAKANAENKGLNSSALFISAAKADFGPGRWHSGRKRRVRMKNTHVEIYVREAEPKETEKAKSKKTAEKKK